MNWRKSSRSIGNGQCVEVMAWRKASGSVGNGACVEAATYRKSSHSIGNGQCVEAASPGPVILVRDSKNPDGPVLPVSLAAWREFTRRIKTGEQA